MSTSYANDINASVINPIITNNGISVYQDDIDRLCDEYISSLNDPNMIYKSTCFFGMLKYINRKILDSCIDSRKGKRSNYKLLDVVFDDIYMPLCTAYNIAPSILQFCCLCNIDYRIVYDVKNGTYRATGNPASPEDSHIAQKWHKECESVALGRVQCENSIGNMFVLKSVFGYQEAAQRVEVVAQQATETPEQIAQKYSKAKMPELPDFFNAESAPIKEE